MLNYSDFCFLLDQEKEFLIALIGHLLLKIEELEAEKPLTLPELPSPGKYVIRDASGTVRMVGDETKFLQSQVEGMAILFSLDGYVSVQFYLNNCSRLLSEWSNGKRVERC